MTRTAIRLVSCGAFVCLAAAVTLAQTSTTSATKKFQVIAVDGNRLVVKLPEGTRELTVPDDFRFNVDGKMLSVQELKPGMAGSATITTKTTVTPVTVTEVKNGTVMKNLGTSIVVRTDTGMKMFSQADIDKRGIKIFREGKLAEISDFRENDKLTATIVTTKPPRVVTEKEVNATLAKSGGGAGHARGRASGRRCDGGAFDASSAVPQRGGDFGCCSEEAAQDRQLPAGSRARGPRVGRCGVGPHCQAASRDSLTGSLIDAGTALVSGMGAVRAPFAAEQCDVQVTRRVVRRLWIERVSRRRPSDGVDRMSREHTACRSAHGSPREAQGWLRAALQTGVILGLVLAHDMR